MSNAPGSASIYTLAEHVTCRETTNGLNMLFDRSRGVMYELNETASSIVGQLNTGPQTIAQLLQALAEEYADDADDMRDDTRQLLVDFVDAGLLIPADD
jgi:PqqD family protein of HPr-rel-A system